MCRKMKKVLAGIACLSMMSFNTAFADRLMTGDVLNNVGSGGANITGSQGSFAGFETNGSNADLHFNNGDAIINWGHLNVGNGQTLNFLNNNGQAVLNNVSTGMSTFAGSVNSGNGAVIISNPNGMLMTGGQFNAGGAVVLTTEDLSGVSLNGTKLDLSNTPIAGYNNNDIIIKNAMGKQIELKDSSINVFDGYTLSTTDGVSFVKDGAAAKAPVQHVAGTVKLSTVGDISVSEGNVDGILEINKANDITINGGTISNRIKIDANGGTIGNVNINSSPTTSGVRFLNIGQAGEINVTSNYIDLRNVVANSINAYASGIGTYGIYTNDLTVNNDAILRSGNAYINIVDSTFNKNLIATTGIDIDGKTLTLPSGVTGSLTGIMIEDSTIKNNAILEAKNGPIAVSGGSIGNDLTAIANTSGQASESSSYVLIGGKIGEDRQPVMNRTSVGGNTYLTALKGDGVIIGVNDYNIVNPTIGKDLSINVDGNVNIYGGNVLGETIAQATGNINYYDYIPDEIQANLSSEELNQEASKILNNLAQSGVDASVGGGAEFTPIAFAANEDKDSARRKIANASSTVYRSKDNVIHIGERVNMND